MLPNSEDILCTFNENDTNIYIHQTTIDNFMKHDPPCKECLIQIMCIKQDLDHIHNFININLCNELREFIKDIK
jgi:hypothetical protein